MFKLKIVLACLALLAFAPLTFAQAQPRHIDVGGEAEIRVVPDEAIVTLGVESWAVDINAARKDNDGRIAKILAVPTSLGIDSKYVQTGYISIEPIYLENDKSQTMSIASYKVRKDVTIVVKDLRLLDSLVAKVLNAGANRFNDIQFRTSRLRELRDQARIAAIKAAKEKATALAQELGQKIGTPLSITENAQILGGFSRGLTQNFLSQESMGDITSGPTMSIGQISISANVSVSFELANP